MKIFITGLLLLSNTIVQAVHQPGERVQLEKNNKIAIVLKLKPKQLNDSVTIQFIPANYIMQPQPMEEKIKHHNGIIDWVTTANEPIYLNISGLLMQKSLSSWFLEPGDQIIVTSKGDNLLFSGKGSEKCKLQYRLDSLRQNIAAPSNPLNYRTKSLEDYFEWDTYLHKKFDAGLPLIESAKGQISPSVFESIKEEFIRGVIGDLASKFASLKIYITSKKNPITDVINIYDTSFCVSTKKWLQYAENKAAIDMALRLEKIYRDAFFDEARMPPKEDINLMVYKETLKTLSGIKRERFIVNNFPERVIIKGGGFRSEVEELLAQYYAEPGYPEWKKWMKEQEMLLRENKLRGKKTPEFSFTDADGKNFNKEGIKGKYAVLHFYKNGKHAPELQQMKQKFKGNKQVVFVDIPVEKITDTIMLRDYVVTKYPTVWIMHPNGYVLNSRNPKIEWEKDNGKSLVELILRYFSYVKDGPYVLNEGNTTVAYTIDSNTLFKTVIANSSQKLNVQTDLDKTFPVVLKPAQALERSTYNRPEKLLALSDIEGNFDAFRKLLQVNKIIDENFNWIFGKGHLVFAGDMFDRGLQVTECLWLMYSLEEKAKAVGGYVHFVLGNHEIMNLKGQHKYVKDKYKENANLMDKTLTELYSEDSELGRWLRTKNIIETIGDLLFVHGGISPMVRKMPLTITEINELARPYYAKPIDTTNNYLKIIFGDRRTGYEYTYPSPFWFRGFYGDIDNLKEVPTTAQLDSTLNKYGVKHIITGHTIIADTISVHYGGRVINTDTKHASGKSEALLIEGPNFYRVNTEGKKNLLFTDNKRKTAGK